MILAHALTCLSYMNATVETNNAGIHLYLQICTSKVHTSVACFMQNLSPVEVRRSGFVCSFIFLNPDGITIQK